MKFSYYFPLQVLKCAELKIYHPEYPSSSWIPSSQVSSIKPGSSGPLQTTGFVNNVIVREGLVSLSTVEKVLSPGSWYTSEFNQFDMMVHLNFHNNCFIHSLPRYGALGVLYTVDEYRGRGFAKICMQFMSKHVQSIGLTPFTYVETDNVASIALMEKLGFEPVQECLWILTRCQK